MGSNQTTVLNMNDEEITINYDELCLFRTTEKAWCITWGSTVSQRSLNFCFVPKKISHLDTSCKEITVPEWFVNKNERLQEHVG